MDIFDEGSSLPGLPADDSAILECAVLFEAAVAAEAEAEAIGEDESLMAAGDCAGRLIQMMAGYRAASFAALLAQARGLAWLYAPDGDRPVILADAASTLEERLVRAVILGLLDLSRTISTEGDVHAQVK